MGQTYLQLDQDEYAPPRPCGEVVVCQLVIADAVHDLLHGGLGRYGPQSWRSAWRFFYTGSSNFKWMAASLTRVDGDTMRCELAKLVRDRAEDVPAIGKMLTDLEATFGPMPDRRSNRDS